jgi:hypothetical protein
VPARATGEPCVETMNLSQLAAALERRREREERPFCNWISCGGDTQERRRGGECEEQAVREQERC